MQETELIFEREERNGIAAVGSYLYDAARRLGIEVDCERLGESDDCAMRIKEGAEFLSEVTEREKQHLTSEQRTAGERLACQVKIQSAGTIVVMTNKKKEEEKPKEEVQVEEYRKQFEELPLEKKISSLLELEGIALSETFSFVLNSPSHIVSKIMDVLAEFGLKIEESDKKAKRPPEHKDGNGNEVVVEVTETETTTNGSGGKPKKTTKKTVVAVEVEAVDEKADAKQD